jgi:hypothetical protein
MDLNKFTIIAAMAVHVSDQKGVKVLRRCLQSIHKAVLHAQEMYKRPDLSMFIHLAVSACASCRGSVVELVKEFDHNLPNLSLVGGKIWTARLSQFQHYERMVQECENDHREGCTYIGSPENTFVMFSDGDDIWDVRRFFFINQWIRRVLQRGLVETACTEAGAHRQHFQHRLWCEGSAGSRVDVKALPNCSYLFQNAIVAAQLVTHEADAAQISSMLGSPDDPNVPKEWQQAAVHSVSGDANIPLDSGWDAEYWACVVPFGVFKAFFDRMVPPGKTTKDRHLCPILRQGICDLAFAQFVRDSGFVDMAAVIESTDSTVGPSGGQSRMAQPWLYCHVNDGVPHETPASEQCVLLSLSPQEVSKFSERCASLTLQSSTLQAESHNGMLLELNRMRCLEIVREWDVGHILSEDEIERGPVTEHAANWGKLKSS